MNNDDYEQIYDYIEEHIENYFREGGKDRDAELLDFIFSNEKLLSEIVDAIANSKDSKLTDKIVQWAFENLPEGPEYEPEDDMRGPEDIR